MPYDPKAQGLALYKQMEEASEESPYGNARVLCISPCLPSYVMPPLVKEGLKLPFFDSGIKPAVNFSVNKGCNTCEIMADFMIQFQPFLLSLGLPMCYLKCAFRVMQVLKDMQSLLTDLPLPDIGKPLQDIALAIIQCQKCFTNFSPGRICAIVRDAMDIMFLSLRCIINMLRKLITLNLKIAGLSMDPNLRIQKTARCMQKLVEVDQDQAALSVNALGVLFDALNMLLEIISFFLNINPPLTISPTITANLSDMLGHTPLDDMLDTLEQTMRLLGEGITSAAATDPPTIHGIVCDCAKLP